MTSQMISLENAPFEKQLDGYRLTTAQILYHLPDYPRLLQEFVWQQHDLAPHFPVLNKFLGFWERTLDGKLHSVKVASATLISTAEINAADGLFKLH